MGRIPHTQIESWLDVQEKLPERMRQVFSVIMATGSEGAAIFEIAEAMGFPPNWVTSSLAALRKKGLVENSGGTETNHETGKRGIRWRVTMKGQGELF